MATERVNIRTIAKMANTSTMTVSRVLNNKPDVAPDTKERILKIIEELNYKPHAFARSLSGGKTNILGLALYTGGDTIAGLYVEVMRGLQAGLADVGYDLLLLAPSPTGHYSKRVLEGPRVLDGLVLMGHETPGEDLVGLRDGQFPFVTVGRREFEGYTAPYFTPNYKQAFYDMVTFVKDKGAKNIAVVISLLDDRETSEQPFIRDRLAGIYQGARRDEIQLISSTTEYTAGYEHVMAMRDIPDAILLDSSDFSFGVVMGLRDRQIRVPEDVLLAGLDNENFLIRRCEDAINQHIPQWYVPWFDVGTDVANYMVTCITENTLPDIHSYIDFQTRHV